MGTIILIIAVIIFVSIFFIFRLFSNYKIDNYQALIVNYAVAASLAFLFYNGEMPIKEVVNQDWFLPSSILGLLFATSFLIFAVSTQKMGMAITSVASKMSVIIPVTAGVFIYESESLSSFEITGLLFAMASFYLIFRKDKKEDTNTKYIALPIVVLILSGINDTLMKYIREVYFNISESTFDSEILFIGSLFAISFTSSLVLFGIPIIIKKSKIEVKNIVAGAVLGSFNFLSAFTMFKAMGYFPSAIFFPIFNVAIVSLSALLGILFFKEKMSKINYIGLAFALGAILMLTVN